MTTTQTFYCVAFFWARFAINIKKWQLASSKLIMQKTSSHFYRVTQDDIVLLPCQYNCNRKVFLMILTNICSWDTRLINSLPKYRCLFIVSVPGIMGNTASVASSGLWSPTNICHQIPTHAYVDRDDTNLSMTTGISMSRCKLKLATKPDGSEGLCP